jgi:hypothetical protein
MFQRFAAATAVASIVIALAVAVLGLMPGATLSRIYPITMVWCLVPLVWGVWALLVPPAWLPQRLPLWGAILGLVAGSLGAFVLNMPSRLLGVQVALPARAVGFAVMVAFYYLLWMLVRVAYRNLTRSPSA